jgi:hypothetical protein|nr:MAG TPA: hypothetical protein [Caudoviricetes sp.]
MKEKTYFEILEEMEGQKDSEREKRIEIGEKCLDAIKSLENRNEIISVNHLVKFNGKDYNISISEWKGFKDGICEI